VFVILALAAWFACCFDRRHVIADNLGHFSQLTGGKKNVEEMVGGQVTRVNTDVYNLERLLAGTFGCVKFLYSSCWVWLVFHEYVVCATCWTLTYLYVLILTDFFYADDLKGSAAVTDVDATSPASEDAKGDGGSAGGNPSATK